MSGLWINVTPPRNRPVPRIGRMVNHCVFGIGKVIKRSRHAVCVEFPNHGMREFMWAFALRNMRLLPKRKKSP